MDATTQIANSIMLLFLMKFSNALIKKTMDSRTNKMNEENEPLTMVTNAYTNITQRSDTSIAKYAFFLPLNTFKNIVYQP